MFSDRFRWLKMAVLSLLLILLCLYNYFSAPPRLRAEIRERIAHPEAQTEPARVGFAQVIEVQEDGTARVLVWGMEREVLGAEGALKAGDVVSFAGRFDGRGRIRLETFTVHGLRWLKKAVSLVAALILLVLMARGAVRRFFRREDPCRT